jgi:hypothetical protein
MSSRRSTPTAPTGDKERQTKPVAPKPKIVLDELDELDGLDDWDNETAHAQDTRDTDDPTQRVTVVPSVPVERYVEELMKTVEAEDAASGVHERMTPISPSDPSASEAAFDGDSSASDSSRPTVTGPLPPDLELDDPCSVEVRISYTSLPPEILEQEESEIAAQAGNRKLRDLRDRHAVGDFSGALQVAESILEAEPEHVEAQRYAKSCREVLMQMYTARTGGLDRAARVALPGDQIRWLSLDHRAGFLLSLVDGNSSVEEILDMSGMPRLDALRIVCELIEQRVIALGAKR